MEENKMGVMPIGKADCYDVLAHYDIHAGAGII